MVSKYRHIYKIHTEGNPVVTPIDYDKLSYEDKRKALDAIKLIKENRNRIIKGRTCAVGSKQNRYLK